MFSGFQTTLSPTASPVDQSFGWEEEGTTAGKSYSSTCSLWGALLAVSIGRDYSKGSAALYPSPSQLITEVDCNVSPFAALQASNNIQQY